MQDGDTDGDSRNIDREKHGQLPCERTCARVRIRPEAVPDKVAGYRADKRNRSGRDKGHACRLREQIHHPEIDHRADLAL